MTRQGARDSLRHMGQERDHKYKTSSGHVILNEFIFKEKKSNNFLRWEKYWKLTRSLEYGTELKIMIQNMIDGEFPLFERLEEYPEVMEIKPSKESFIIPQETINLMREEQDMYLRENIKAEAFSRWVERLETANLQTRRQNEINKSHREKIHQEHVYFSEIKGQLVKDIQESISKESMDLIKNWNDYFEDEVTGDVKEIGFEQASRECNFLWFFKAARETHLQTGAEESLHVRLRHIEDETDKLRRMRQGKMSYPLFQARFDEQIEVIEIVGQEEVLDLRKTMYLIEALNPQVDEFKELAKDFKKAENKGDYEDKSYADIKKLINLKWISATTRDSKIASKLSGDGDYVARESTFKTSESKLEKNADRARGGDIKKALGERKDEPPMEKCPLCFLDGAAGWHRPYNCHLRDKKFKLGAQIAYAVRQREKTNKGTPIKTVKEPVKLTSERMELSFLTSEVTVADDMDLNIETVQEKVMRVSEDWVQDFVFDTASAATLIMSDGAEELLQNVRHEKAILAGMFGGEHIVNKAGDAPFGLGPMRIVKDAKGDRQNVLSQYRISRKYKMCEQDDPDVIVLRPWGKGHTLYDPQLEGIEFWFERNSAKYGDVNFHCAIDTRDWKREYVQTSKEKTFYSPKGPGGGVLWEPEASVEKVEYLHRLLGHLQKPGLLRCIEAGHPLFAGVTVETVAQWHQVMGELCAGCLQGRLKEQSRTLTSKPHEDYAIGEAAEGDLMFIEISENKPKIPVYVQVDVASKCIFATLMKSKTLEELQKVFKHTLSVYRNFGRVLKQLVHDREAGVIPLEGWLLGEGVRLQPKAAGQAAPRVESNIGIIRASARAIKAGVRARLNYLPLAQWNPHLLLYTVNMLNRQIRPGMRECPYEIFTGKPVDWVRYARGEFGEIVLVKKPRGLSSNLLYTGEWAVIMRVEKADTGVLIVYLVESGCYAYRLRIVRPGHVPSWVIDKLNRLNHDSTIGWEDDHVAILDIESAAGADKLGNAAGLDPTEVESSLNDQELQDPLDTVIESEAQHDPELTEALENMDGDGNLEYRALDPPPASIEVEPIPHVVTRGTAVADQLNKEREAEKYAEDVTNRFVEPHEMDKELIKGRRTDLNVAKMKGKLKAAYLSRIANQTIGVPAIMEDLEVPIERVNAYYEQAKRTRPESAMAALRKEVSGALHKEVWEPIYLNDLSPDQVSLILPMMKNYVEKFNADGVFEKDKVRILTRGDMQWQIGETDGPVARVESIYILIAVAIFWNLELFKVDMTAAYNNTPMPEEVAHKWLRLDKDVVDILMELEPGKWERYLEPQGTILVRMRKLSYGYKEAAHYWHLTLTKVFMSAGYRKLQKDPCFLYREANIAGVMFISLVCVTVDDCLFAATRGVSWKDEQIGMLRHVFEDITVEEGDHLSIIGLSVDMNRDNKFAAITQRNFIRKTKEVWNIARSRASPSIGDGFYDVNDTLPLLSNQKKYMSAVATSNYACSRTFWEAKAQCGHLSTRFNRANQTDMDRAMHLMEYICSDEEHALVICPRSLQIIAASDASYGENPDGSSTTGGVCGFENPDGSQHCWIMAISAKQNVIAKSSSESELIAGSTVGDYIVWMRDIMEDLGVKQDKIKFMQDNMTAMLNAKRGYGSFKRSKHIKVRYFWIKMLVDDGTIEIVYCGTAEMVADILTKPLVGAKFQCMRAKILNWGLMRM